MMKDIGSRIKAYRKHKGLTLVQLGEIIGISHSSVSELETGKNLPSATTIASFLNNTDISPRWLLLGKGAMLDNKDFSVYEHEPVKVLHEEPGDYSENGLYMQVPVHDNVGAGNLAYFTEHEPSENTVVPKYITDLYPEMYYFKVDGWSMFPVIRPGAIVGINTAEKNIISGEIYGIWYDHEGASLKYIFAQSDKFIIKAENIKYPDDTKTAEELEINDRFIIGRLRYLSQLYE